GRAGDELEGRPGRIQALTRAIEKRLPLIPVDLPPRGVLGPGIAELRGVIVREADRRDDGARARIERDDRAAASGKRVDGGLLHLRIDAEDDRPGRFALAEVARAPRRERVAGVLTDERIRVRGLDAGRSVR